MKVIIIPWEVENNKAQWETEWHSGRKIKGLKKMFAAQYICYASPFIIMALLNV